LKNLDVAGTFTVETMVAMRSKEAKTLQSTVNHDSTGSIVDLEQRRQ
jgi:hypothetical protein